MINVEGMALVRGKRQILGDSTFRLSRGEVVGLIAPNGTGKSTLLDGLCGFNEAMRCSSYRIDGRIATKRVIDEALFCVAPDDGLLESRLPARSHIEAIIDGWGSEWTVERAAELLGVSEYHDVAPRRMSQGMKQKLALTLGFATGTPYLLLDEPLSYLDYEAQCRAVEAVENARDQGRGVLMSSHELHLVGEVCDAVYVFRKGGLTRFETDRSSARCIEIYRDTYGDV